MTTSLHFEHDVQPVSKDPFASHEIQSTPSEDSSGEVETLEQPDSNAQSTEQPISQSSQKPVPNHQPDLTAGTRNREVHKLPRVQSAFEQTCWDLQQKIEKKEDEIFRISQMYTKLCKSNVFDDVETSYVQNYIEKLNKDCSKLKVELFSMGDRRKGSEEMEQKMNTRMMLLKECESIVNFHEHSDLGRFFVNQQAKLMQLYRKFLQT